MEHLSNTGNGVYAYIDSIREAQKVLVEQAGANLVTIAKDVKVQVSFIQVMSKLGVSLVVNRAEAGGF